MAARKIPFQEENNDMIELSKTSRGYYAQVQCAMAVTQLLTCDFVVSSRQECIVLEVPFDNEYWDDLIKKLCWFYRDFVIPTMITGNIPCHTRASCKPNPRELWEDDMLMELEETAISLESLTSACVSTPTQSTTSIPEQDDDLLMELDEASTLTAVPPRGLLPDVTTPARESSIPTQSTPPIPEHGDTYRCCQCNKILVEQEYVAEDNSDASVGCECRCGCDIWSCWSCGEFTSEMDKAEVKWVCPMCTADCASN